MVSEMSIAEMQAEFDAIPAKIRDLQRRTQPSPFRVETDEEIWVRKGLRAEIDALENRKDELWIEMNRAIAVREQSMQAGNTPPEYDPKTMPREILMRKGFVAAYGGLFAVYPQQSIRDQHGIAIVVKHCVSGADYVVVEGPAQP